MSSHVVEARLGRPPQDMLEAAVVLEAWAGVPPSRALEAGRALMPDAPAAPRRSTGRLPDPTPRRRMAVEAFAFGVSVVAIALWAPPLRAAIGAEGLRQALVVALPLALALQWGLSSRYLSRPGGQASLRRHRIALALGAVLLAAAPGAALGTPGLIAGLLAVLWTGGTILIRRGVPLVYTLAVAAATPAVIDGAPPEFVLSALAAVVTLAALVRPKARGARARERRARERPGVPGRWDRAVCAALIGAALGLLLVGDTTLGWMTSPVEAVLLVPSMVGGAWGSARLWQLAHALPASLAGVALYERPNSTALRVLGGALVRAVLAVVALSLLAAVIVPGTGSGSARACALIGFGLLALVTLLAGLLESLGRGRSVLVGLGAGVVVEFFLRPSFAGGGLLAGAAVAALILLLAAIAPLRRPAVTVATGVWIT